MIRKQFGTQGKNNKRISKNNLEGLYLLFYFPKLKITKYQRFNYFFLFISQVIGVNIVS